MKLSDALPPPRTDDENGTPCPPPFSGPIPDLFLADRLSDVRDRAMLSITFSSLATKKVPYFYSPVCVPRLGSYEEGSSYWGRLTTMSAPLG